MKIVVHDYSGHPGQIHLSRELADRGHEVDHQFCPSYTTGRGATKQRPGDPENFTITQVELEREFARYSPVTRVRQELQYSRAATRAIIAADPDVAVLSNVPLLSLIGLTRALRARGIPYVFWQQDVYSDAIATAATKKLGRAGAGIGWIASAGEKTVARGAGAVVAISEAFTEQLDAWGVPRENVEVIPNWAAIDEVPVRPRNNAWAAAHDLEACPVVMYAGTLGLKHDPAVLVTLAKVAPPGTQLVVVSQGLGREWLESNAADNPHLRLMDYQPYETLPDMLATADVLLVLLESHASRYSVPSKVLNYLCAGRPVLGLLPKDSSVARTIHDANAGIVVNPEDPAAIQEALERLLTDKNLREQMGNAAREYAERTFDVKGVGDRFEVLLGRIASRPGQTRRR